MNRRLAFLLVLAAAGPAAAQVPARALAGLQAGVAFHEESNLRPGFQTGFGFSLPLRYGLHVAVEYLHWTCSSRAYGGKLPDGKLTVSPVSAALLLEFLPNRIFVPYGLAGMAFLFTRFQLSPPAEPPGVRVDQKVSDGFSPYVGLGARLALSRALFFFAETSYMRRTLPGETIMRAADGGISRQAIGVNVRTVFLKFGLRFRL